MFSYLNILLQAWVYLLNLVAPDFYKFTQLHCYWYYKYMFTELCYHWCYKYVFTKLLCHWCYKCGYWIMLPLMLQVIIELLCHWFYVCLLNDIVTDVISSILLNCVLTEATSVYYSPTLPLMLSTERLDSSWMATGMSLSWLLLMSSILRAGNISLHLPPLTMSC